MRSIRLEIRFRTDSKWAQLEASRFAVALGFSRQDAASIATAVSELVTNVLRHGGSGTVTLRELEEPSGLEVVAFNEGGEVLDARTSLENGWSKGRRVDDPLTVHPACRESLGCGLGAVSRLMDELTIDSAPGRGTTVTARKLLPSKQRGA